MTRIDGLSGPHLAFGKYALTPKACEGSQAAAVLNRYPNRRVEVYGYTDSAGQRRDATCGCRSGAPKT